MEVVTDDKQIPVGAFVLIALGVLFLLNTFGWFHIGWIFRQLWPLILIALGVLCASETQTDGVLRGRHAIQI